MARRRFGRATRLVVVMALAAGGAVAATFAASTAASASTITVTNTADDGSASSLRGVLSNVSAGDTVVLTVGETYQLTRCPVNPVSAALSQGEIQIGDVVTIQGNGATIEQTCHARVLNTQYDITLEDVTITGGDTPDQGGGLVTYGASTTLTGVTFTKNSACAGGAVYATSALTVSDSTFTDNSADWSRSCTGEDGGAGEGGAIQFDPAPASPGVAATGEAHPTAVANGLGDATITDSTFTTNSATNNGGAVSAASGDSILVTGSTFEGNSTGEVGGAISIATNLNFKENPLNLTVVNSTITKNASCVYGAIAALDGSNLVLVYDTMTDNTLNACAGAVAPSSDGTRASVTTATEPTAVSVTSGSFSTFGTVITGPSGSQYCGIEGASGGSLGYNFSDEGTDTCGFTTSTDSHASTNDPQLGALADNTGPTMTQLPASDSPLVDAIPVDACGNGNAAAGFSVTDDQRGVSRPQSNGCDIGAVELQGTITPTPTPTTAAPTPAAAVAVAPKFTG